MRPDVVASVNKPEEKSDLRRVGENFLSVSIMSVAVRLLGLVSGVYIRRIFGPEGMGQINWTSAVTSYFGVLINPGVERIAQRDVAQDNGKSNYYASVIFTVELMMTLVAVFVLGIIYSLNLRGATVNNLLLIQTLALLLTPFHPAWLFYAKQRAFPVAMAEIAMQVLQVIAIFIFIYEPTHLVRYVFLSFPLRFANTAFLVWYAIRHQFFDPKQFRIILKGTGQLFKEAAPIGLTAVSAIIFYNSDAIMLGMMKGDAAVGLYTTAYNLMLVPTFLSGGLVTSYFPLLAKAYGDSEKCLYHSAEYFKLNCWMGIPLAALGWIAGSSILPALYGAKFAEAGPLFQWLCINLALIFVHSGLTLPLTAWKKQNILCIITLLAAAINIGLNFFLIPKYGAAAAVVTTIIAEVIVIGGALTTRRNLHPIPAWKIVSRPTYLAMGVILFMELFTRSIHAPWWVNAAVATTLMGSGVLILQWPMVQMVLKRFRKNESP